MFLSCQGFKRCADARQQLAAGLHGRHWQVAERGGYGLLDGSLLESVEPSTLACQAKSRAPRIT
jgi:hypothetical protein